MATNPVIGASQAMILAKFPTQGHAQVRTRIKASGYAVGQAQTSTAKFAKQTGFGQAQVQIA